MKNIKQTKHEKKIAEQVELGKIYSFDEACELLKKISNKKFDESIDVCINLGIDVKKSDQTVRGAVVLPNGTGKSVKVAVFAKDEQADQAKKAGADIVGFDDLYKMIESSNFDFDILIATPEAMKLVGKLGQILGPKGLMPNPKVGTVTNDVEVAVRNAKSGRVQFKADKGGIVHCIIGKLSFATNLLKENLKTLLGALNRAKPASAKGIYIKKVTLTSTLGPGLLLDVSSIE